ncbi:unannotated protein [freshwater metagenome]|uniref:Unannotated protein n=1 Tax=freshwater metagenome TaxID=449393 RepID=A0A6J6QIK8_9ZZZZ
MHRTTRIALIVVLALIALPAAAAKANPRMQIGFFDDPSFRWSKSTAENLQAASKSGATVIHVLADWSQIASAKPASPLNGDDPAYKISDLDSLVSTAPKYGMQVIVSITGTPKWANGGQTPNHPPTNMGDLTAFAHMLAARYNGLHPGYGVVSRFAIWNEPNLQLFLTPQFENGQIVSPGIYAKLFAAGYAGIKAGNPLALVAAGNTSNRGHNTPTGGVSDSTAPATFARLLAIAAPKLKFDAWATHPYPTSPNLPPTQKVQYPAVTLTTLDQFGSDLKTWWKRRVPIWITEYGEQTRPQYSIGVSASQQAADAKTALQMAAKNPYVDIFVWFIFRDSTNQTWFSGLKNANGSNKPSYATFSATAKTVAGQTYYIPQGGGFTPAIDVPQLFNNNPVGSRIGLTYAVFEGKKKIAVGQPPATLAANGTVSAPISFRDVKGHTYSVVVKLGDKHGVTVTRTIAVIAQ